MGTPELEVHPDDLDQVVAVLTAAGAALHGHTSELSTSPDAGRSTGEVAKALAALSTAVAGMAEELGRVADSTGAASALILGTDGVVATRLDAGRGVSGP